MTVLNKVIVDARDNNVLFEKCEEYWSEEDTTTTYTSFSDSQMEEVRSILLTGEDEFRMFYHSLISLDTVAGTYWYPTALLFATQKERDRSTIANGGVMLPENEYNNIRDEFLTRLDLTLEDIKYGKETPTKSRCPNCVDGVDKNGEVCFPCGGSGEVTSKS